MAEIDIAGPVDCAVLRFSGNRFTGEIVPALQELVDTGTVRIIDLVFVTKDSDGNVAALELSEMTDDAKSHYDDLDGEIYELLTDEDVQKAGELLEPESSAAVLVWENTWASRLAAAIRSAGGELVAFERIPLEAVRAAIVGAGS